MAFTSDAYQQQITAGTSSYGYDALDRLLTGAAPVSLTYSGMGDQVASDGSATYSRDPSGAITGVDTAASGKTIALSNQHTDLVGMVAPSGSAVAGSAAFDPWGKVTGTTGTQVQVGYQGAWTDPAAGGDLHAYAGDNPVTLTDPSGHCALVCVSSIVQAVANAANAVAHAVQKVVAKTVVPTTKNVTAARHPVSVIASRIADASHTAVNYAARAAKAVAKTAVRANIGHGTLTQAQITALRDLAESIAPSIVAGARAAQTQTQKLDNASRANTGGTVLDSIANGQNPAGLRGLVEVKSGIYIRADKQIRAQLAEAAGRGLPYNLVVGPKTGVSAGLQQAVSDSGGQIARFNPMTGLFSGF